jgi:hypothetical protein
VKYNGNRWKQEKTDGNIELQFSMIFSSDFSSMIEGLYTANRLHSSDLGTKINTVVISSGAAAILSMLVIVTAGFTTTIFAQQYTIFAANLSGSNEVPPVTTAGSGIAIFQLVAVGHQQIISYQLNLENINGVTGAHIHSGKQLENGPIVAGLFNSNMSGPPNGAINGLLTKGTLTSSDLTGPLAGQQISALVDMIRTGGAYVNVHTTQNQNGEVRGQIS